MMRRIIVMLFMIILVFSPVSAASYSRWSSGSTSGRSGSSSSSSNAPTSYSADSESTSSVPAVKMKLTAAESTGVFAGFSTTPYEKDGDTVTSSVTPTTSGTLKIDTHDDMGTITASGKWYAYWTVRNNKSNLNIILKWSSVDSTDLFGVYEDEKYESAMESGVKLKSIASSVSSTQETYPLYIRTADLREWYYDNTYTLNLTLEVQST